MRIAIFRMAPSACRSDERHVGHGVDGDHDFTPGGYVNAQANATGQPAVAPTPAGRAQRQQGPSRIGHRFATSLCYSAHKDGADIVGDRVRTCRGDALPTPALLVDVDATLRAASGER